MSFAPDPPAHGLGEALARHRESRGPTARGGGRRPGVERLEDCAPSARPARPGRGPPPRAAPCRRPDSACSSGGRAAGEYRSALENRLARIRSSRPGSASTSGKPSGTAISSRRQSSSPTSAAGATSSIAVGRRNGCSDPVCRRLMSSRLPMRASSRSAFCSIVASRSASSASDHSTSVCRRLLTLALIEASGVRRSWLTAASSAVRIRLPSASASACGGLGAEPFPVQRGRRLGCVRRPAGPGVADAACPVTSRIRSLRMSMREAAGQSCPRRRSTPPAPTGRPPAPASSAWPPWVAGEVLEHGRGRVGAAQHGLRQLEQRGRLLPGPRGLHGAPGGQVDHAADGHRDRHEQQQRQQARAARLNGERVQRHGEVPVEQHAGRHGGEHGRPEARRAP